MAQWVKDLALSLLWYGFSPWPQGTSTCQAWPKKKKKKFLFFLIKKDLNNLSFFTLRRKEGTD